ncbi:hypothetical protein BV898_08345 [Hypsibius exemplaris]|uniref:Secreted protein n=1 Tax=Hypsibius exemplaris TaxID=2072580 RepID=A0A1W0WQV0_HYPEX|nr:hypothetical protein BV898_08345 [Hypsibius exemplaris]
MHDIPFLLLLIVSGFYLVAASPLAPQRWSSSSNSRERGYPDSHRQSQHGNANAEGDEYYSETDAPSISRTTRDAGGCRVFKSNGMNCRECITKKGGVTEREERCTRVDTIPDQKTA